MKELRVILFSLEDDNEKKISEWKIQPGRYFHLIK